MLSIQPSKVNSRESAVAQAHSSDDGGQLLTRIKFPAAIVFSVIILALVFCAWADQPSESADEERAQPTDTARPVFQIKPPQGFKQEQVDENNIFKWKKDSAEIYVVVGDLFFTSSEMLFKAVKKASEADKNTLEIKTLRIKGGKAMLYKEKASEDPERLRTWRLVVITDKKVINVDFSAPSKDFETFVPAFEEAIKSFRLTSSS